jgi:hypothetical protein
LRKETRPPEPWARNRRKLVQPGRQAKARARCSNRALPTCWSAKRGSSSCVLSYVSVADRFRTGQEAHPLTGWLPPRVGRIHSACGQSTMAEASGCDVHHGMEGLLLRVTHLDVYLCGDARESYDYPTVNSSFTTEPAGIVRLTSLPLRSA